MSNPSGRRTIIRNQIQTSVAHQGSTAAINQQTLAPTRKRSKARLKLSNIAIYAAAFVFIVSMIAVGYRAPQQATGTANVAAPVSSTTNDETPTVDAVVAASVAADIAQSANLPVAASAVNLSVSTQIKSELSQSDDSIISKPQISQPSAATRTIAKHRVVEGETVASIAKKYKVSTDTIKWANDLTTDTVVAGKTLEILPVSGVVYTVRSGDTIKSIAEKYKADASRITVYNDLEATGINPGLRIVIPSGTLPTNERPGYIAPITYTNYSGYSTQAGDVKILYRNTKPTTPGNTNAWGNCTWYAWERRLEIGRQLPSRALGNAAEWAATLQGSHTVVRGVPRVGAVLQTSQYGYGYGHVGVVEDITSDGTVIITEMNYAGYNVVSQRTISAGQAALFNYIY